MAKTKTKTKPMTAQELAAIDWNAFLQQAGPLAAMFLKMLLDALLAKQAQLKAAVACPDCPQEVKDACCDDLEKFADYVASRLALHKTICGDDCETK